jgi:geranylgeranylglycerol-phosphate geranylgeranyltransferase
MMSFAILVGAVIGGGVGIIGSINSIVLSFITGFTLTGAAMAINDYYDREVDAINEPDRPIPSGAISPREAFAESILLSIIGLIAALFTGLYNLVLAVFAWVASMLYSTVGKGTGLPGNALVSVLVALPFIYGGIIAGNEGLGVPLLFSIIAFLTNTGREVTKGIVDIEGDRTQGIKTLAVDRGPSIAAWVSAICYVASVIVSFLPIYLEFVSFWYLPIVILTDMGLLYSSFTLLRDSERENSRKVKNWVRILMISGLLGFFLGSLF